MIPNRRVLGSSSSICLDQNADYAELPAWEWEQEDIGDDLDTAGSPGACPSSPEWWD